MEGKWRKCVDEWNCKVTPLHTNALGNPITEKDRRAFEKRRSKLRTETSQAKARFGRTLRKCIADCTSLVCCRHARMPESQRSRRIGSVPDDLLWETWRHGYEQSENNKLAFLCSLMSYARVTSLRVADNRLKSFQCFGIDVCWCCFCAIHGVRAMSIEGYNLDMEHPEFVAQAPRTLCTRQPGHVNWEIQQFIAEHYEFLAEWNPEGSRVRIPADIKFNVYHRWYAAYCLRRDLEPAHYSYFCYVWRSCFAHVSRTDKSKFGQCKVCQSLNKAMRKCVGKKHAKLKRDLFAAKSAHVEYVRNCRRVTSFWFLIACWYPHDVLFLNGDRMDSLKTRMPKPPRDLKNSDYGASVSSSTMCHVTNLGDIYAVTDKATEIHTDSCRQFTEMQTLQLVAKRLGHVPRTVCIVEDNAKENKNHLRKYLWGLLVHWEIVDRVQFFYMPIGHTHGPVDRQFGRVSTLIGGSDGGVMSPRELGEVFLRLDSEGCGPHKAQLRTLAYWLLRTPNLNKFWKQTPIKAAIEAIRVVPMRRMVISRAENGHVAFQCFDSLFKPAEILKIYNFSDPNAASEHGKCGSYFSKLVLGDRLSPNCTALAEFTEWWKSNILHAHHANQRVQPVTVDFSCVKNHLERGWFMGRVRPFDPSAVEKGLRACGAMEELQLKGDNSWEELFKKFHDREVPLCDQCRAFSKSDLDCKRSIAASQFGKEGKEVVDAGRRAHRKVRAAWAKHLAEQDHLLDTPHWNLKCFRESLERPHGMPVDSSREFDFFMTSEDDWVDNYANVDRLDTATLEWDSPTSFPDEFVTAINEKNRMFASSAFLNGRFETLLKLDPSLSGMDDVPRFDGDVLQNSMSFLTDVRVWDLLEDSPRIDVPVNDKISITEYYREINRGQIKEDDLDWNSRLEHWARATDIELLEASCTVVDWTDDSLLGKWVMVYEPLPNSSAVFRIFRLVGRSWDFETIFVERWQMCKRGRWKGCMEAVCTAENQHARQEWPFSDVQSPQEATPETHVEALSATRYGLAIVCPWDVVDNEIKVAAGVANEDAAMSSPIIQIPFHIVGELQHKFSQRILASFFGSFLM